MGLDVTGIGALATAAEGIINHFFPDKTQEEKSRMALELQGMMNNQNLEIAQLDVDKAEAQSSDPLQHWRGGLGWVCVMGYAWNFVGLPLTQAIASIIGHPLPLPSLDIGPLATLTLGMLGLGGLHVAERIKGVS